MEGYGNLPGGKRVVAVSTCIRVVKTSRGSFVNLNDDPRVTFSGCHAGKAGKNSITPSYPLCFLTVGFRVAGFLKLTSVKDGLR